jgi:hypothetical protein
MPSLAIREFSYDRERAELTVTFETGRVYVYAKVPEFTFQRFARAASKGRFFNTEIRDKYRFRKLAAAAEDQDADHGYVSSFREALRRTRNPSSSETDSGNES